MKRRGNFDGRRRARKSAVIGPTIRAWLWGFKFLEKICGSFSIARSMYGGHRDADLVGKGSDEEFCIVAALACSAEEEIGK